MTTMWQIHVSLTCNRDTHIHCVTGKSMLPCDKGIYVHHVTRTHRPILLQELTCQPYGRHTYAYHVTGTHMHTTLHRYICPPYDIDTGTNAHHTVKTHMPTIEQDTYGHHMTETHMPDMRQGHICSPFWDFCLPCEGNYMPSMRPGHKSNHTTVTHILTMW